MSPLTPDSAESLDATASNPSSTKETFSLAPKPNSKSAKKVPPWIKVFSPNKPEVKISTAENSSPSKPHFSVCRVQFKTYEIDTPIRISGICKSCTENTDENTSTNHPKSTLLIALPDSQIEENWNENTSTSEQIKSCSQNEEVKFDFLVPDVGEHFVEFAFHSENSSDTASESFQGIATLQFLDSCKGGFQNFPIKQRGDISEESATQWTKEIGGDEVQICTTLILDADYTGSAKEAGTWNSLWKEMQFHLDPEFSGDTVNAEISVQIISLTYEVIQQGGGDMKDDATTTPFLVVEPGCKEKINTENVGQTYGPFSVTIKDQNPSDFPYVQLGLYDVDNQNNQNNVVHRVIEKIEITITGEDLYKLQYSVHEKKTHSNGGDTDEVVTSPTNFCFLFELKEVTYEAGWDVLQDVNSNPYPEPHWQKDSSPTDLQPCPYLYGGTKNRLKIKRVEIHYKGVILPGVDIFVAADEENGFNFSGEEAIVNGTQKIITVTNMECVTPFEPKVKFFNKLKLKWKISIDAGKTYVELGESETPVYVCLTGPVGTSPPQLFRTTVHTACGKDGSTTADAAVERSWEFFTPRNFKGWNESSKSFSRTLYYYRPGTTFGQNAYPTTEKLLRSPTDSGQCTTWASLLRDAAVLNGAQVTFIRTYARTAGQVRCYGFLVKNMLQTTSEPPLYFLTDTDSFDMIPVPSDGRYGDFKNQDTIVGQNSSPPSQKIFRQHFFPKTYPIKFAGRVFRCFLWR